MVCRQDMWNFPTNWLSTAWNRPTSMVNLKAPHWGFSDATPQAIPLNKIQSRGKNFHVKTLACMTQCIRWRCTTYQRTCSGVFLTINFALYVYYSHLLERRTIMAIARNCNIRIIVILWCGWASNSDAFWGMCITCCFLHNNMKRLLFSDNGGNWHRQAAR